MNTQALLDLAARLRALPDAEFDMANWWAQSDDGCGTVACLAGHAALMAGATVPKCADSFCGSGSSFIYHKHRVNAPAFAQKVLGLSNAQAAALFHSGLDGWPVEYRQRYKCAHPRMTQPVSGESTRIIAAELLEALARGEVQLNLLG